MKLKSKEIILNEEQKELLRRQQIDILNEFVRICNENNLRYFLIGGTCLGAVRHKGFIPWDDDIDVGMPRIDYDKFASLYKEKLGDDYYYQDHNTDPEYPYLFAKIRKNKTIFLQDAVQKLNIHQGIYIDIFPIDGVPSDPKTMKKHFNKVMFNNYIQMSSALSYKGKTLFEKSELLIIKILKFILGGKRRIANRSVKLLRRYDFDGHTKVGNLLGMIRFKEIMDKSILCASSLRTMYFEENEYVVPVETEKYLEHIFGDYMKLPPEDKRVSHHGIIKIKF